MNSRWTNTIFSLLFYYSTEWLVSVWFHFAIWQLSQMASWLITIATPVYWFLTFQFRTFPIRNICIISIPKSIQHFPSISLIQTHIFDITTRSDEIHKLFLRKTHFESIEQMQIDVLFDPICNRRAFKHSNWLT